MELPSTPWVEQKKTSSKKNRPVIKHTFTHFHLELTLCFSSTLPNEISDEGLWCAEEKLTEHAFPTVMKKVIKAAQIFEKNTE